MTNKHAMLSWGAGLMHSIHHANFLIQRHLEQRLAESGRITFAQFLVLMPVHCKERASQTDIAEATSLTEATVSRHVSALAEEGLLTRTEDPTNRRKHVLALTAKGARELDRAYELLDLALQDLFTRSLSEKEREALRTSLSRITAQLIQKNDTRS